MSRLTDKEHQYGTSLGIRWWEKSPQTTQEKVEYGLFEFRLYDYHEAVRWFLEAADEGYEEAAFMLAYCMHNGLGIKQNANYEMGIFNTFLQNEKTHAKTAEGLYKLGVCAMYVGKEESNNKAVTYFSSIESVHAAACFELGENYHIGGLGLKPSDEVAMNYFLKADQLGHMEAILHHFALSGQKLSAYAYAREVKEAFSFKLGRLIRVAEVNPNEDSYNRVIQVYKEGYPGDEGEAQIRFQKKALYWEKRLAKWIATKADSEKKI